MRRQTELQVVGPRALRIESYYSENTEGQATAESVWLLSGSRKVALETPALVADLPFTLDRFAIAPNADFIFGSRKVVAGESEMFLWVRQKDKSYKLLPETVNQWIVRRTKSTHKGKEITFVRLVRWLNGGNGVALSSLYFDGRKNLWHMREIDLVRGKFGPERAISESKLTFLI